MSDKRRFQAWCGLSVLVALTFIGLAIVGAVQAHDFYDPWCCDGQDCEPYKGAVREESDGYHLDNGLVVAYDYKGIREAPDGRFHICMYPADTLRCFYRPARSF